MLVARRLLVVFCVVALSAVSSLADAEDTSKEACLAAHGEGQDEKEQGHVAAARQLLTTCAQPSCPVLLRDDCARLADELDRMQPSLSFSARDAQGADLPDTSVFVDGELLITRLDGMWYDVDPGMHVVRFEHAGQQQNVSVVVGSGEKGRAIIGVFAPPAPAKATTAPRVRSLLAPKLAIAASSALVAVAGTLLVVGFARVPDNCKLSTHECAAAPGDKAFHEAARAVRLSNYGWVGAGVGVAALAASLFWYFKAGKSRARRAPEIEPFATSRGLGLSLSGRM